MEFNDRRPVGSRYVVLSQHQSKSGAVRTKKTGFDVYEDAKEHAGANHPGTDPTMRPNLDRAAIEKVKGYEYASGATWHGNQHAAVLQHSEMAGKYR